MAIKTIFLFAHNDDEYFVLPMIRRALMQGEQVFCIYTTDGTAYGADAMTRHEESLSVLLPIGVPKENCIALGATLQCKDGELRKSSVTVYDALHAFFEKERPSKVVTLAYEGGHSDHDATHVIAAALTKKFAIKELYEFSAYNAYKAWGPLFHCMKFTPTSHTQDDYITLDISFSERLRWFATCFSYTTQWKTFIGLSVFCFIAIFVRRAPLLRVVKNYSYRSPPHSGSLLYEKRFGVPFAEQSAAMEALLERVGL